MILGVLIRISRSSVLTSGLSKHFQATDYTFKMVDPGLSFANNPCPSLWNSNKPGGRFLLEGYSSNVSICSLKGLWGFTLVTSGKLSLGTRGNIHERSHTRLTRVPASFRNQFSLIYLAPIPHKSGLVALNTCLISCR